MIQGGGPYILAHAQGGRIDRTKSGFDLLLPDNRSKAVFWCFSGKKCIQIVQRAKTHRIPGLTSGAADVGQHEDVLVRGQSGVPAWQIGRASCRERV